MNLDINLDPFKEPRGFIRLLQWLFGICAFATTCNFSTEFSFSVACIGANSSAGTPVAVRQKIEYPFALDHQDTPDVCNNPNCVTNFYGNAKSDAQFFVTTGVLSFLFATISVIVYAFADKMYMENPRYPAIDFGVTLILAIFWLSGSAALAVGISNLRHGANPRDWFDTFKLCKVPCGLCSDFVQGSFSGLVISILFGFINFVLWGGNLWFLYKETTWFDHLRGSVSGNPTISTPTGI